jgi:hypothetical protein
MEEVHAYPGSQTVEKETNSNKSSPLTQMMSLLPQKMVKRTK